MILLDTHIWVWWTDENPKLTEQLGNALETHREEGLGVSAISLWEVAKLYEKGRLEFSTSLNEWLRNALELPGIELLPLNASVATESVLLPGSFHRDPADQIIVATARIHEIPLVTFDSKILEYEHVQLFGKTDDQ